MAEVAPPRLLESLPARPPTPPRETTTHHDGEAAAPHRHVQLGSLCAIAAANTSDHSDPRSSLQTPPSAQSLLSSAAKPGCSSSARRKKVEFEFTAPADADVPPPPVVPLPPSAGASRPTKSILKAPSGEAAAAAAAAAASGGAAGAPANLADMLASTVQQLVGADRDAKLDAYLMLARALKTSDNLPDRIALQSKMPLFTHFIQRDVTASKAGDGTTDGSGAAASSTSTSTSTSTSSTLDATLAIAALDLLITFLRFSAIASTLPADFGVFIVDHCIRSIELAAVPRDVLRTLMRVVALQSFPPKVMTADRVGRLVAALHRMDPRYETKNTVVMRAIIYRTLVKNSRLHMALHLDWLPDLLADMLSTVAPVRDAAIGLGLDAAFALGRERSVAQRVAELLQATVDDERYLDYYATRLRAMSKNKAESAAVPQVWSVITLFLRTSLEKWDFFMDWLRILQACFNSSDYRTKEEANYAWSRFAYALLRENRALSRKLTTMLTQPLVSQLRRRAAAGTGKSAHDFRRIVLGCAGNLFYYTMRDPRELDNIWDHSVQPVLLQLLELSAAEDASRETRKANLASACALLTGLVDCAAPRPWQEDRIVHCPIVAPHDLPAVDPKWTRRNAARVFALVGPILDQSFLDLAVPRSATQTLWRAVVGAVAAAAAKEVKVAPETAAFVGHAFSLLLRLWTRGVPATPTAAALSTDSDKAAFPATQFLAAAREYLLTMVDSLGCLPFTERQLARDASNAFVPVATPSQRLGKGQGHAALRTPLRHLFAVLSAPLPPGVPDDDEYADFTESVFAPFFSAKSGKGRRTLAYDLLLTVPADAQCPYGPWQVVASRIAATMTPTPSSSTRGDGSVGVGMGIGATSSPMPGGSGYQRSPLSLSPAYSGSSSSRDATPVGHDYREVVRVLERGLRCTPALPWVLWEALLGTLCDRVRDDAGAAGVAMCVLEPLAKAALDVEQRARSPTAARAVVALVSLASHPRDRQAVDAARRRLWGVGVGVSTAISASGPLASLDPLDHLYRLVGETLAQQYAAYDPDTDSSAPGATECTGLGLDLLRELADFLDRSHEQLFVNTLAAVQDGLACWVRDEDAKVHRASHAHKLLHRIWSMVRHRLDRTSPAGRLPLNALEYLLCAAFASKHLSLVNSALGLWNQVYGGQAMDADADVVVDCPEALKATLMTLHARLGASIAGMDADLAVDVDAAPTESSDTHRPMLVDSQEDDQDAAVGLLSTKSVVHEMEAATNATPTPTPTPAVAALATASASSINRSSGRRGRSKTATPTPRARHDDSQIEFTAIVDPVLPSSRSTAAAKQGDADGADGAVVVEEPQVLTDRQREVRDRQRETHALYADVMSSSPSSGAAARRMAARAAAAALPPETVTAESDTVQTMANAPGEPEHEPEQEEEQDAQQRDQLQPEQEKIKVPEHDLEASSPVPSPAHDVALPEQLRAATPEPAGAAAGMVTAVDGQASAGHGGAGARTFSDDDVFIASTPTPRRGPVPVLPMVDADGDRDHDTDMDPPSSPPEPRRYPLLLPELASRSRSNSSSILDEWQFSSSPLSGSPMAARHTAPEPELSLAGGGALEARLRSHVEAAEEEDEQGSGSSKPHENKGTDEAMEDTPAPAAVVPPTEPPVPSTDEQSTTPAEAAAPAAPSTPTPRTRTSRRRSAAALLSQETASQETASQETVSQETASQQSSLNDADSTRPQSLPRTATRRSGRRAAAAKAAVAQSSPVRCSVRASTRTSTPTPMTTITTTTTGSGRARRRYKLMAMPPASQLEQSFRMSDGEERSMLRLAIELDMAHKQARGASPAVSTGAAGSPSVRGRRSGSRAAADSSVADPAVQECITVRTSDREEEKGKEGNGGEEEEEAAGAEEDADRSQEDDGAQLHSSQLDGAQLDGSQRSLRRRKRKRSVSAARPEANVEGEEAEAVSPEAGGEAEADQPRAAHAAEDDEVQSQLALELEVLSSRATAKRTVVDLTGSVEEEGGAEGGEGGERPAKKRRLTGILSMLRGSLALLQTAALSRAEVGEIEDVCMDVKRALYDAERRGRASE